jgi:hypothetical protein
MGDEVAGFDPRPLGGIFHSLFFTVSEYQRIYIMMLLYNWNIKLKKMIELKHLKFFNIIPEVLYDKFKRYSDDYLFNENKEIYIHNILNRTNFVENMSYNKE